MTSSTVGGFIEDDELWLIEHRRLYGSTGYSITSVAENVLGGWERAESATASPGQLSSVGIRIIGEGERVPVRERRTWKPDSRALERRLAESRWIIGLPADPEEKDSPRYEEQTWQRAASLLAQLWRFAGLVRQDRFPLPAIGAAEGGAIDLFWRSSKGQLLVCVYPEPDSTPLFSFIPSAGVPVDGEVRGTGDVLEVLSLIQSASA